MNQYDEKKQQVQAAQGQSAPAAQNPEDWNRQLSSIMDKINNREPFSFDLNGDALYQQYKDQYQKLGRAAMQDTVGQASGLTGGYGSTYAENAGQQAYNAYLDQLNNIVPDIYAQQRSAYDAQNSELYNQFSLAQQMYGNARTAQADADSKILTLLQMGVQPSAADVAASGYSQDEIDKMYQYYKTAAAKAGSGGGSSKKATTGKVPDDETMAPYLARYKSLIASGMSEDEAAAAVMDSLGYLISQGYDAEAMAGYLGNQYMISGWKDEDSLAEEYQAFYDENKDIYGHSAVGEFAFNALLEAWKNKYGYNP